MEADVDNSGSLSLSELIGILRKKGYSGSDEDIKKIFRRADDSDDGMVSLDEYMVVMGEQPEKNHKQAAIRSVFRSFDKDGSGTIDKAELKAVFDEIGRSLSDSELNRIIEMADRDGSDTLDYEEFVKEVFGG